MATHIDVGISRSMAWVLATKPTIDYLCDNYDGGGSIRDNKEAIQLFGGAPAAADCPQCLRIATLLHSGFSLDQARATLRKGLDQ
jgi:hypothetical protein